MGRIIGMDDKVDLNQGISNQKRYFADDACMRTRNRDDFHLGIFRYLTNSFSFSMLSFSHKCSMVCPRGLENR